MHLNRNSPVLLLGLIACATTITITVFALGQSQGRSPSPTPKPIPIVVQVPPNLKIQRQSLKASALHEGMTRADIEKIMGQPTDTKVFPNLDTRIEILNYRQELIVTKVSMIDGILSGVTTEPKPITQNNLPKYAQVIQVGMNRNQVVNLLGQPLDQRRKELSIYKFEQLTFRKGNELPINVILRDDRVETVSIGSENPANLLGVILPAQPTPPTKGSANERIRVGMNPQQVVSIFGQPTTVEYSELQQQPVVHLVYAALNTDASTRFTFINNVLTRFSFIPQSNLIQAGG
jgi:outer membrane protein assembly factor BamE (lipoprotein component of BamABCDE complex)